MQIIENSYLITIFLKTFVPVLQKWPKNVIATNDPETNVNVYV